MLNAGARTTRYPLPPGWRLALAVCLALAGLAQSAAGQWETDLGPRGTFAPAPAEVPLLPPANFSSQDGTQLGAPFGQPQWGSSLERQNPDWPPLADEYSGHAVTAPLAPEPTPPATSNWPPLPRPSDLFRAPQCQTCNDVRTFQLLPPGLLYQSYLAGQKEPRISSAWLNESDRGLVWDVTLGGRVGLFRYGTSDPLHPQGFQLDMEGAALIRLDPEENTDVEAADYRFGFLATWREGPWAAKAGYYHLSSHLGDEFLLRNPGYPRYNYVRDAAIAGLSYDMTSAVRLYAEGGYAIGHQGGALPWEFQYGAEYSSIVTSTSGGPYAAVNGHSREDFGWITGVNVVSGWQWRGAATQHRFRVGMQYYHGPALQWSFVGQNETLVGGGLWFDY
jgi:hypothetical protein